ncbi:MAG: uroporphyrinogen decarboxylase family protein [Syntrophomonadaceae bacterium]|nr:uroporphyrinogen decarboxylase family protein [Syntrophomonadaceae bacterium]
MNAVPRDEMTPKERMSAFAAGRKIDRIPCSSFGGETACHLIGTTISQYRHSAKLMAEVEIAAYQKYHHDGAGVGPGFLALAEAMGSTLKYPEDNIPFIADPALKNWTDFDKLSPCDPHKDGKLPMYLEALSMIKDAIGEEVPVSSGVGGPFTTAGLVRGTENFLKDLRRNPEMVQRLLHLVTETTMRYMDAVIDMGCNVSIGDPTASGSLLSVKQFREFAKPYLKILEDHVIERTGKGCSLHICGDSTPIWADMADTGAPTLSLDNVIDLAEAKKVVGHRTCISGNVKPVETLMKGSHEQIEAEVKECLRKAWDNPKGFVLAIGCQIPLGTPPENFICFMNAARKYGRYPLNPENFAE